MEFHLAGHVRTLEDFLTHLGIVTLGILIALGLYRYESFTYLIDTVGKGALQSCDRALR